MDSALHVLSGCQCPVICNMVTEQHSIASSMILKVVSKGSYGLNTVHMDVGSADHLAPVFLTKLDATPAAPMLPWPLLALLTQIDHLLPPHIGYSAV
eukprot:1152577-Pelagomonas_calceolata.AAC.1